MCTYLFPFFSHDGVYSNAIYMHNLHLKVGNPIIHALRNIDTRLGMVIILFLTYQPVVNIYFLFFDKHFLALKVNFSFSFDLKSRPEIEIAVSGSRFSSVGMARKRSAFILGSWVLSLGDWSFISAMGHSLHQIYRDRTRKLDHILTKPTIIRSFKSM